MPSTLTLPLSWTVAGTTWREQQLLYGSEIRVILSQGGNKVITKTFKKRNLFRYTIHALHQQNQESSTFINFNNRIGNINASFVGKNPCFIKFWTQNVSLLSCQACLTINACRIDVPSWFQSWGKLCWRNRMDHLERNVLMLQSVLTEECVLEKRHQWRSPANSV
jgi:hypothetical protein